MGHRTWRSGLDVGAGSLVARMIRRYTSTMRVVMHLMGCLLAWAMPILLIGCAGSSMVVSNPLPIAEAEYDRVYDAAVDVLREMRFVVERQDRRFGVITTRPLISASIVEPWHDDNLTGEQAWEATLNHQRRQVRVMLNRRGEDAAAPVTDGEPAEAASPDDADRPAPAPTSTHRANYLLQVEVVVERRHHPDRQLTTAAFSSMGFHDRAGHVVLTEAGYEASEWVPIGSDPILEQQLVAAIIRRSIHVADRYVSHDASTSPIHENTVDEPAALSDAADPDSDHTPIHP